MPCKNINIQQRKRRKYLFANLLLDLIGNDGWIHGASVGKNECRNLLGHSRMGKGA